MVSFLIRLFVKDSDSESRKREIYGGICGGVGIFLNLILCIGKILAGMASGSIAIMADGFNNLSDAGSSIIALIGFRLASLKPDKEHPYGHGRMEYIAGLIVSGLIFVMAYQLFRDSVMQIIHPKETDFSIVIAIILVASILVKCYMAFYNNKIGKEINSATIRAIAKDSLGDCIATGVVLLSGIIENYFHWKVDGYAGIIVALFILNAAISAAKETINPLLGVNPEPEFIQGIHNYVLAQNENILAIHDLMVHDYGPGRKFISLHAEVPAEGNILELHDIVDNIEVGLEKEFASIATIHMDPVVTTDTRVTDLKQKVKSILNNYNSSLSIHDFRVVFGNTHTNLIFDMVIPFGLEQTDLQIQQQITTSIQQELGEHYRVVMSIDKE